MSSLVSVIVPVYNTVEYVEECIQSILSQSYKDIELIMVNDGSTDGSGEICRRYQHFPNVYYVEQENCGTTAARRRGVEMAQGVWFMFVDSDDLLMPEAIAGMVNAAKSEDILIGGNQHSGQLCALPDYLERQQYLEMQYARELSASPCAKLFRKSLFYDKVLSFPRHINRGEDYLMNLILATNNQSAVGVYKHQVYWVRENPHSTRHTHPFSLDYMFELSKLGDGIVKSHIAADVFRRQRVKQRMYFFLEAMADTHFRNDPRHPFIQDIKTCMNEAGVWQPIDRWLLSASSPWAVKTVWNLRKVEMRILHPSMIAKDLRRIVKPRTSC